VHLDVRCWKVFHALQLYFCKEKGFVPSRDYVLSELLVDPERGAQILRSVAKKFEDVTVPKIKWPRGNRYKDMRDPNRHYARGAEGQKGDWGREP
jgi:hypothetical protein